VEVPPLLPSMRCLHGLATGMSFSRVYGPAGRMWAGFRQSGGGCGVLGPGSARLWWAVSLRLWGCKIAQSECRNAQMESLMSVACMLCLARAQDWAALVHCIITSLTTPSSNEVCNSRATGDRKA
jgi:hypothetical protein